MAAIDVTKYSHSPTHKAVVTRDYTALRKIIAGLPRLCDPSEIHNESVSLAEEAKAEAISAVIDRRDVVNRDTPLHLAVKFGDVTATEMLMLAGADWSLQNEQGWSALQEAICNREETIARIIVRHYQPIAWGKWCRRLPRLLGTMRRMRDFYMEITFQFESSVIPFISRIAPSDTYKIWKRGANLRADMTLAGFDGFRIQRADQTVLFLGDGSEDGKVPSGSLCMISHKNKEVMNALDGAGAPASDEEVQQEVQAMSSTNIFRPGIDVTQAVLLPQITWRRQEKTETVGAWKCKVYDMHNVVVSIKSRRVPGAMSDDEFFSSCNENETESEELNDILTDEERKQLEAALKLDSADLGHENNGIIGHRHSCYEQRDIPIPIEETPSFKNGESKHEKDKKGWFDGWRKRDNNNNNNKHERGRKGAGAPVPPRGSLCLDEKVSDLLGDSPSTSQSQSQSHIHPGRHSLEITLKENENRKAKDLKPSSSTLSTASKRKDAARENEYKKGLRPVLWLAPNFPLRTEELLPLLDILANKVKAIRRLRDLLTTKLPMGTFPVKVAIPVIPTIRVLVTFTKFEELQPLDEFTTPPSSPTSGDHDSLMTNQSAPSSSWFQWIKTPYHRANSASNASSSRIETIPDPFAIPADYTWISAEAKKKKMQEKNKSKKGRSQSQSQSQNQ
ncbi:putative ankyrin repeat domain-containing protein [Helianthus annuus]|nr:putative ankyrin repeat domain-containing protein [Helianthus annuus]